MPVLENLTCCVKWKGSDKHLREYAVSYQGRRYAYAYLAIPEIPTPFYIQLRSSGYIAAGIAMYVYIDGVYQCNRNRRDLKPPGKNTPASETEVNFKVRQKETILSNGEVLGQHWNFARVQVGSKLVQDQRAPNNGRHIGTIDVLILRCGPVRRSSSISGSTLNATSHPSSTTSRYPDGSPLHSVLGAPRWEKARMPKYSNLRSFGVDGTCDDRNPMETIGKKQKWGIKIVSKTKGTYGPLDEDTSDEGDVDEDSERETLRKGNAPKLKVTRRATRQSKISVPQTKSRVTNSKVNSSRLSENKKDSTNSRAEKSRPKARTGRTREALTSPVATSVASTLSSLKKRYNKGKQSSEDSEDRPFPDDEELEPFSDFDLSLLPGKWPVPASLRPKKDLGKQSESINGTSTEDDKSQEGEVEQSSEAASQVTSQEDSTQEPTLAKTKKHTTPLKKSARENKSPSPKKIPRKDISLSEKTDLWRGDRSGEEAQSEDLSSQGEYQEEDCSYVSLAESSIEADQEASIKEEDTWSESSTPKAQVSPRSAGDSLSEKSEVNSVKTSQKKNKHLPTKASSVKDRELSTRSSSNNSGAPSTVSLTEPSTRKSTITSKMHPSSRPSTSHSERRETQFHASSSRQSETPKERGSSSRRPVFGPPRPPVYGPPPPHLKPPTGKPQKYVLPENIAKETGATHQVLPGGPQVFKHSQVTPEYIDTFEEPYAVFRFVFRSKKEIEKMLHTRIESDSEDEKERLKQLSKKEMLEELLRTRKVAHEAKETKVNAKETPSSAASGLHLDLEELTNKLHHLDIEQDGSTSSSKRGSSASRFQDNSKYKNRRSSRSAKATHEKEESSKNSKGKKAVDSSDDQPRDSSESRSYDRQSTTSKIDDLWNAVNLETFGSEWNDTPNDQSKSSSKKKSRHTTIVDSSGKKTPRSSKVEDTNKHSRRQSSSTIRTQRPSRYESKVSNPSTMEEEVQPNDDQW